MSTLENTHRERERERERREEEANHQPHLHSRRPPASSSSSTFGEGTSGKNRLNPTPTPLPTTKVFGKNELCREESIEMLRRDPYASRHSSPVTRCPHSSATSQGPALKRKTLWRKWSDFLA